MSHQIRSRSQKVPVGEPVVNCRQAKTLSGGMGEWFWRRKALRNEIDSYRVGKQLFIPIREIRRVISEGYKPRIAAEEQRGVMAQVGQ